MTDISRSRPHSRITIVLKSSTFDQKPITFLFFAGNPLTTCAAIDFCGVNPCNNGGSCSPSGSSFICSCLSGIKGERCEEDENECLGSPCQNGGSCVNSLGSYSCDCTSGFNGENCSQDVDECAGDNPCNNGQCLNRVSRKEYGKVGMLEMG